MFLFYLNSTQIATQKNYIFHLIEISFADRILLSKFKDDFMKRYICLVLILSLCLSLASCSVKKDSSELNASLATEEVSTSLPKPDFDTAEFSKEFMDENGRVVYTVKAKLPKFSGNIPENINTYLNGFVYGIFEDACETAESNIANAASFMDAQHLENPWARSFDYDINFCDGKYLSFTVKDYFTMYNSENLEPDMHGYTFDIIKGVPCTLLDFSYENYSFENVAQILVDEFICDDVSNVFYNGAPLTDEQREIVHSVVNPENFYLTDTGIGFYFSKSSINPSHYGTFISNYTWDEVAVVLKMPV